MPGSRRGSRTTWRPDGCCRRGRRWRRSWSAARGGTPPPRPRSSDLVAPFRHGRRFSEHVALEQLGGDGAVDAPQSVTDRLGAGGQRCGRPGRGGRSRRRRPTDRRCSNRGPQASHMRCGRRRPTPATSHTGTSAWRATAAAAREPLTARNRGPDRRGLEQHEVGLGHRGPEARLGDVERLESCRSNGCTKPEPSPTVSMTSTSRSPRPGQRGADHVGPAQKRPRRVLRQRVGELRGVVSAGDSPAASHISLRASPAREDPSGNQTRRPMRVGATRCGGTR